MKKEDEEEEWYVCDCFLFNFLIECEPMVEVGGRGARPNHPPLMSDVIKDRRTTRAALKMKIKRYTDYSMEKQMKRRHTHARLGSSHARNWCRQTNNQDEHHDIPSRWIISIFTPK